jgi:hypothetical protein
MRARSKFLPLTGLASNASSGPCRAKRPGPRGAILTIILVSLGIAGLFPGVAIGAAPTLLSVGEDSTGHATATWSVPPGYTSDFIEVASNPTTDSDGWFLDRYFEDFDELNPDQMSWRSDFRYGPGDYYVHLSGCPPPSQDPGCTGYYWSNILKLEAERPLQTKIKTGPKHLTDERVARFKFTSSRPNSTFKCKLDNRGFKPCRSPKTYRSLSEGRHTFKVRATDAEGTTDPTPATWRWEIRLGPAPGRYSGTTSQGRPVHFTVSRNGKRIKRFAAGVRLRCRLAGGGHARASGTERVRSIGLHGNRFRKRVRTTLRGGVREKTIIKGRFGGRKFRGMLHVRLLGPGGSCDSGAVSWKARK